MSIVSCTCYLRTGGCPLHGWGATPVRVTSTFPVQPYISVADSTLPMTVLTWTWREAIEVANRAQSRARVHKQGDRWLVSWRAVPILQNWAS